MAQSESKQRTHKTNLLNWTVMGDSILSYPSVVQFRCVFVGTKLVPRFFIYFRYLVKIPFILHIPTFLVIGSITNVVQVCNINCLFAICIILNQFEIIRTSIFSAMETINDWSICTWCHTTTHLCFSFFFTLILFCLLRKQSCLMSVDLAACHNVA